MDTSPPDWLADMLATARLPMSAQLIKKAEAAEAQAKSLEHCMWTGDHHPAEPLLEEARLLRMSAAVWKREEDRKAKHDARAGKAS
ncbi:hypothetical protein KABACHOK_01800 [Brevundimonas phage vB_BpoS-Kabachok]|uniref:Uncharacterized protein n=1 Tax=Brevundimonas phage vB_BpoS-Kabachok TaxID=2948600 RepID=A0A9E7MQS7_9CAUD|nr:hypothetical protein KABACHOK_01800 [Brevundimonas phage vB_BpoS-Kabachok]